jgi:hypothetical protein
VIVRDQPSGQSRVYESAYRTKEMWTPILRCTLEHSRQM